MTIDTVCTTRARVIQCFDDRYTTASCGESVAQETQAIVTPPPLVRTRIIHFHFQVRGEQAMVLILPRFGRCKCMHSLAFNSTLTHFHFTVPTAGLLLVDHQIYRGGREFEKERHNVIMKTLRSPVLHFLCSPVFRGEWGIAEKSKVVRISIVHARHSSEWIRRGIVKDAIGSRNHLKINVIRCILETHRQTHTQVTVEMATRYTWTRVVGCVDNLYLAGNG